MTKAKIILRADGNSKTGLGHLYRIVSVMEMLKNDFSITLVTRRSSNVSMISKEYSLKLIPELDLDKEVVWLKEQFDSENSIFILDGYDFNSNYQKEIARISKKLIYIDDFAKDYKEADIIINHSPSVKASDYKSKKKGQLALGTNFSLLRPLFLKKAKEEIKLVSNKKVLVCFGGADFEDLTNRTVKLLLKIKDVEEINVILGSSFANSFDLKNEKINTYKSLSEKEMLEKMEENDRIIVPSSTILYEAICCKKYILSGYYIDNQTSIYNGFKNSETMIGVGNFLNITDNSYLEQLKRLLDLEGKEMLINQKNRIDGKSDKRIINLIKEIA